MNNRLLFTALLLLPMLVSAQKPPENPVNLAALQKQIQQAYGRVAASTVTLFGPQNSFKGSGVIIQPDGLILTHGHHGLTPGTPMTVMIAGKQKVAGKLLGVNHYFDQSLIRLEGPGPYPAVSLGDPSKLKPGETCLLLGFPRIYYRDGRPPLLRIGRILGFAAHQVLSSCRTEGGDSGGPLFNLDGELLATHQMTALKGEHGAGHPSVDCYRQIREQLLAGVEIKTASTSLFPISCKYAFDPLYTEDELIEGKLLAELSWL